MIWILEFPVLLLLLPYYVREILAAVGIYGIFCFCQSRKKQTFEQLRCLRYGWKSAACSAFLGYCFYQQWAYSGRVAALMERLHLPLVPVMLAGSVALSAASIWGIDILIGCFMEKMQAGDSVLKKSQRMNLSDSGKADIFAWVVLLAASVITMTICSKSSPLYPLNDWVDANVFFTMGKSLLKGMLPFRDLYDQKGPLLYFMHTVAAMVSFDSFLGVYLWEILWCYFTLLYLYKILRLYYDRSVLIVMPLASVLIYTSAAFCYGDSAEEMCLPLLAYGLYVGLVALREDRLPNLRESFLIGVTSSCVLWIKFTMLGFYIGWIVIPAVLAVQRKRIPEFCRILGTIFGGVLVGTLPYILFFGIFGGMEDWLRVYLYDNIFLYNNGINGNPVLGVLANLGRGLGRWKAHLPGGFLLTAAGIVWVIQHEKKSVSMYFLTCLGGLFFFVHEGGKEFLYYNLALAVLGVFGLAWLYGALGDWMSRRNVYYKRVVSAVVAASAVLTLCLCANVPMMFLQKEDIPQFRFKADIENSGIENPTLLNYDFLDGAFYTATGIVPITRYFCQTTMPLADMRNSLRSNVEEGLTDFVVTRKPPEEFAQYRLLDSCTGWYEGEEFTFCLYIRK